MGWLFKIEESKDDGEWAERLFEIQLLRRRIEKLRDTLCGPQRPIVSRDEEVQEPRHNVEEVRKKQKNDELNELKRKLMGGKK